MTKRLTTFTIEQNGVLNSPEEFLEREKIPTKVFLHSHLTGHHLASLVADRIRNHNGSAPLTIGIAADSGLYGAYEELIRLHNEEKLSFKNVVVFSLGEFYPIDPSSLQSYNRWLRENFLDFVDIPKESCNLLEGNVPLERMESYVREYEEKIQKQGGIDLFLLGIHRSGYIGFQEPGSSKAGKSRLISLDPSSRFESASDFFGEEHVPRKAVVMGVTHLMNAKEIIGIAVSEGKAKIIKRLVEESSKPELVLSLLQNHGKVTFLVDTAAASELTRFKCPWLVKNSLIHIQYSPSLIRKAVIWLALTVNKAILKLTDDDYIQYNLLDLLTDHGPASKLNVEIFNHLNRTITGWPGGKPGSVTTPEVHIPNTPAPREPLLYSTKGGRIFPKKILIFSPHPDDDVISMGGTLRRLVEQGHEVHVAYQTSGNIAVRDDDAQRFANFATEFAKYFKLNNQSQTAEIENSVEAFMETKKPAHPDSLEVKSIKGLIRRTEARQAARFCGVKSDNIHFLELPFYETGKVKKKPLGEEDVSIVAKLLQSIQPQQIYAAGDLSDPHGTHRVCLKAIFAACEKLKKEPWYKDTQVWLYRGAWQEWELWDIEMAIPMSPAELFNKRLAIYRHQSQKDPPPFPGLDKREFWERSEARNKATAKLYDLLGLVEYEGMEAFVTWDVEHPDNVPF